MAYEITVKIVVKKDDGKQEVIETEHECNRQTRERIECKILYCSRDEAFSTISKVHSNSDDMKMLRPHKKDPII